MVYSATLQGGIHYVLALHLGSSHVSHLHIDLIVQEVRLLEASQCYLFTRQQP